MTSVPALPSDQYETGLEDFGQEDAVIPRLSIVQKEALFKDSLTGEKFGEIDTIMLGLVKQRVLFHSNVEDGDWPMCRSQNHETGFPNVSEDQPRDKRFPWALSGFDAADWPEGEDGLIRLPCGSCQLKEWGSHPDGKKPYCAEQFTIPLLYKVADSAEAMYVPAIISFQKTGLKPLKAYLTGFSRSKTAAFQAVTRIGLTPQQRGQTDYAVPWFRRVGDSDDANWPEYATNYRTMRTFLIADPGFREDDGPASTEPAAPTSTATQPKAEPEDPNVVDAEIVEDPPETPAPAAAAPAAEPAPAAAAPAAPAAADDDDDDLPF